MFIAFERGYSSKFFIGYKLNEDYGAAINLFYSTEINGTNPPFIINVLFDGLWHKYKAPLSEI